MTTVVRTSALTKTFGRQRGITHVDLDVRPGEIFGFLGPNGAGKSTTIRLVLGLYRPSGGQVTVFDLDPWTHQREVHSRIGYLPGEIGLFPNLTGRDHLDRLARVRDVADLSYRDELARRFDADLDRPVRTLSRGNRQKIGVIAAFMHRPELLVLDEPTTGLDPLLQDEFARLVRETVDDGRTIFLSSHELDEVQRVVDRLAIIKEGEIVVTDTVEGLRNLVPRSVELQFAVPVDPAPFGALPGVEVTSTLAATLTLAVTGPVAQLLRLAADLDVTDITARRADLDELFLSYYRTGNERSNVH